MRTLASALLLACLVNVGHSVQISRVHLDKGSYVGGSDQIEGVVLLDGNAPAGGIVIPLSDNSSGVETPASVTILEGQNSASFVCTTTAVTGVGTRVISATYGGLTHTAVFNLTPPSRPLSILLSSSEIESGETVRITVPLDHPMANSGGTMTFADNSSVIILDHPEVFVPKGAIFVENLAFTGGINIVATRQISASLNGVTKTVNILLQPTPGVASLVLRDAVVVGGSSTGFSVTLSGYLKPSGNTLGLASSNASASVSPTLFVPGAYGHGTVNTNVVTSTQLAMISAHLNGTTRSAVLMVLPH